MSWRKRADELAVRALSAVAREVELMAGGVVPTVDTGGRELSVDPHTLECVREVGIRREWTPGTLPDRLIGAMTTAEWESRDPTLRARIAECLPDGREDALGRVFVLQCVQNVYLPSEWDPELRVGRPSCMLFHLYRNKLDDVMPRCGDLPLPVADAGSGFLVDL